MFKRHERIIEGFSTLGHRKIPKFIKPIPKYEGSDEHRSCLYLILAAIGNEQSISQRIPYFKS
jgi:hypothetical protein